MPIGFHGSILLRKSELSRQRTTSISTKHAVTMSQDSVYRELEIPVFNEYKAVAFLVKDVQNWQTIKENLIKANTEYDYAFINAKNIVSLEQIYSAFYKAMLDNHHGTMKSRTLHTEVIYALSPFKNIMDCLNKFGVSKSSDSLLIMKIVPNKEVSQKFVDTHLKNIGSIVQGKIVALSDSNLQESADVKVIEKNYKLKIKNTSLENDWDEMTRSLVSMTQLKGL
jgi:EKC/KEOPS complex subunit CGI121/TPRKB